MFEQDITFPAWAPIFVDGLPAKRSPKRHRSGRVCSIEGCGRKHRALGLCAVHHAKQRRAERIAAGLTALEAKPRHNRSRVGRLCVVGCGRPVHARDWCHSHYKSHAPRKSKCWVPGCGKIMHAQGLCDRHYMRAYDAGRLQIVRPINRPIDERFADSVAEPNAAGCRIWTGSFDKRNVRGCFTPENGIQVPAHRYAWKQRHGAYPVDANGNALHLDHHCRVGVCVNPDHLEPVTPQENTHRGLVAAGKRNITQADMGWFWVALNAWRHGADNFPTRVVTKHSRVTVIQIEDVAA